MTAATTATQYPHRFSLAIPFAPTAATTRMKGQRGPKRR